MLERRRLLKAHIEAAIIDQGVPERLAARIAFQLVFKCSPPQLGDGPVWEALGTQLREEVVEAMGLAGRIKLDGRTLLVIGTRSESDTFPYGYFGWWELDPNTGTFERL